MLALFTMFMPFLFSNLQSLWTFVTGLKWYVILGALVVIIFVAGWFYMGVLKNDINGLTSKLAESNKEATALKIANDHLVADALVVQQALDTANKAMVAARDSAAKQIITIHNTDYHSAAKAHPRDLEDQINQDTATLFDQMTKATSNASH